MLKIGLSVAALSLSLGAQAAETIELRYADQTFSIPAGFTLVGDIGDSQNLLVFRYGNEPGKRFLAFADMTDDQTLDYGCPTPTFYKAVFFDSPASDCDQAIIDAMQDNFVDGRDVATWSQGEHSFAYSGHDNKAFLFVFGEDTTLLRIDSDFIEGESLQRIVDHM